MTDREALQDLISELEKAHAHWTELRKAFGDDPDLCAFYEGKAAAVNTGLVGVKAALEVAK